MIERESPEQEARRLLAESTARLKEAKERHRTYWSLIRLAGEEMESAYDAYMEADTEEAWQEFDSHATLAIQCLKTAICHMPDYTPLWVEKSLKSTIEGIIDIRIDYWDRWGRKVKAEREAARRPTGAPTCPAQVLHGIRDMRTVEAAEFCLNRCEYQDRCIVPIPKQRQAPAPTR